MHSELEKKIVQKILKKMQFGHTRCEDLLVETLGNDILCIALVMVWIMCLSNATWLSVYVLTIWYFGPFGNAGLQSPRGLPSP